MTETLALVDAKDREWRRAFEYHLDQLPPLMDAMGMLRMPTIPVSRGGSRFDKLQISGGNSLDYVPAMNVETDDSGRIVDAGVVKDAADLWGMAVEYVRAVTAWLNTTVPVPYEPILPSLSAQQWAAPRVNGDPLTARAEALHIVGWLIDHADTIQQLDELEPFREDLFACIRRAKARYRGAGTRRRARPRPCEICGECAVIVDWVDGANGSPKPVQVGRCKVCGQVYTEETAA